MVTVYRKMCEGQVEDQYVSPSPPFLLPVISLSSKHWVGSPFYLLESLCRDEGGRAGREAGAPPAGAGASSSFWLIHLPGWCCLPSAC